MRLRGVLASIAAGILLVAAGCSGDAPPDDPPTTSSAAPPTPGTSESETESPTSSLGPEEQAAADAALAAYDAAWELTVVSRRDPGAKPDWSLDYRQVFGEPALSTALGTVYGLRDAGLANPSGAPVRAPGVVAVDLAAASVSIVDCVDLSQWPQVYVATGQPNTTPQAPITIEAQVAFSQPDARWVVIEQTPDPDRPC